MFKKYMALFFLLNSVFREAANYPENSIRNTKVTIQNNLTTI